MIGRTLDLTAEITLIASFQEAELMNEGYQC